MAGRSGARAEHGGRAGCVGWLVRVRVHVLLSAPARACVCACAGWVRTCVRIRAGCAYVLLAGCVCTYWAGVYAGCAAVLCVGWKKEERGKEKEGRKKNERRVGRKGSGLG